MEKVISSEIIKYILALGIGVIALSALMAKLVGKFRGTFKPYIKQTVVYLLVALIFFSVVVIIAHPALIGRPFTLLIVFQAYFLLIGCLHIYFMHQHMKWSTGSNTLILEMVFTLLVATAGSIGFLLVYRMVNENGMGFILLGSLLFFIIPFFFYQAFEKAIAIPPKVIKEWFYPVGEEIDEPEDSKMKNLLVISFEFQKQINDPQLTNFRAKAPADMEFGQLFYYFINDYNERHSNSKIQIVNAAGEAHGWVFYKKERWFSLVTKYIDFDKTIFNNHIKENEVIICTRSLL